jgi:hypothetical protein
MRQGLKQRRGSTFPPQARCSSLESGRDCHRSPRRSPDARESGSVATHEDSADIEPFYRDAEWPPIPITASRARIHQRVRVAWPPSAVAQATDVSVNRRRAALPIANTPARIVALGLER